MDGASWFLAEQACDGKGNAVLFIKRHFGFEPDTGNVLDILQGSVWIPV